MPNVDNINTVIAMIRAEEVAKLEMGNWLGANMNGDGHYCGTSACIAGFAAIAHFGSFDKAYKHYLEHETVTYIARDYLGINYTSVFYGESDPNGDWYAGVPLDDISPSDAINVLEQIRDTGTYSWKFHHKYQVVD